MSKLLINEQPLQVIPSLAKAIGLNEAIFLQQLHYFLRISKNHAEGRSWVYNTIKDWQVKFSFWSLKTVQRTIENLELSGLVLSTDKFNKMKMDKTKWYSIDYEKLSEIAGENANSPFSKNDQMEHTKTENAFSQNDQSNNQRDPKDINNNPLPLNGESANAEHSEVGGADKPHIGKKQNSIKVDYSAVAETYNTLVKELNSNLPLIANPSQLSDKRKKAIKKLAQVFIKRFEIDTDVEDVELSLGEYIKDFLQSAPSFYFGENNRGWKADFEYILRETTLDKVLEGNW